MRLFRTELIDRDFGKVHVDPVLIEVFKGPRDFTVLKQTPVIPAGRQIQVFPTMKLHVPDDDVCIALTVRSQEDSDESWCEGQLDRTVAIISATLSASLFEIQVFTGWICEDNVLRGGGWVKSSDVVIFDSQRVEAGAITFSRQIGRNQSAGRDIFTLMAKLFARALTMPPGEGRFLWLWTALEVYPMMNRKDDIQCLCDYLAQHTNRDAPEVKQKLGIGPLFGARSTLVHKGKLPYDQAELGTALVKLEAIVLTIIRSLGGLQYAGELNTYLS